MYVNAKSNKSSAKNSCLFASECRNNLILCLENIKTPQKHT